MKNKNILVTTVAILLSIAMPFAMVKNIFTVNAYTLTPPTTPPNTSTPTKRPTSTPTIRPTSTPTKRPTSTPTIRPTNTPTRKPTPTIVRCKPCKGRFCVQINCKKLD